ncbi:integumentary mucin A.1-like isoform X2 [Clinocottus analis]|uniref:integumentary mucin A.1-like isoform X2 n=1 Tax=Clinocottus analis TaxID=304258 RepID=UPI0035C1BF4A
MHDPHVCLHVPERYRSVESRLSGLSETDGLENVTYTLSLVRAEDLEGTVKCTLEHEWKGTRKSGGNLYVYCFKDKYPSAQCQGESSEKIHFIHLMCLAAKVYNASSDDTAGVCEYGTVCKMFSEAASPHSDLTTTTLPETTTTLPETTTATTLPETTTATTLPETTTTLPETTTTLPKTTTATTLPETTTATTLPETTTTLPETTTTLPETTATSLPSSTKAGIATLKPTATRAETATVLPSPPTTEATMKPTATTLAEGQTKSRRNGDKQPDTGNTTGNLKYFLILSLLFNLILPSAVFLYMRRQRAQDHTLRTEIQLQSCTLLSATDNDSETNLLREKPEEKTIL